MDNKLVIIETRSKTMLFIVEGSGIVKAQAYVYNDATMFINNLWVWNKFQVVKDSSIAMRDIIQTRVYTYPTENLEKFYKGIFHVVGLMKDVHNTRQALPLRTRLFFTTAFANHITPYGDCIRDGYANYKLTA